MPFPAVREGSPPTARELEILGAYAARGSMKLTARALGISPDTVRRHLSNVRCRLGVDTTVQAIWILRDRIG